MTPQDDTEARVVRVEVEVPGAPEEVWEAIATGPGIVMRAEEPAAGLVEVFAFDFKGPTLIFVRGYLYGDDGPEAVAREEPVWREWLAECLPGADTRAKYAERAG